MEKTREHIGGKIDYLAYTDDELNHFYKPVSDGPKKVFSSIRPFFNEDKEEKLFRPVTDNAALGLPLIEIDNTYENRENIHIETEENEMTIDLDDHDIYRPSVVNILNVDDAGFVLKLEDPRHLEDGSETDYLFSDKQLDNVHITQLTPAKVLWCTIGQFTIMSAREVLLNNLSVRITPPTLSMGVGQPWLAYLPRLLVP